MKAFLILPFLLASCVSYHDMYGNNYNSAGGDADVTFPGGGHLTHSHTASLQHTLQAASAVAAAGFTAWGNVATTQSNNVAATAQQSATLKSQTDLAKIAADSTKAAGAQAVGTAVVNKAPATSFGPGFLSKFFSRGK